MTETTTVEAEEGVYEATAVIDNGTYGKRSIRFETGRLAQQASGAVAAYLDEDTMLLSATSAGKGPREGLDFFPLTVDVEERMYAAGRIPGSFFRREGRPSTDAVLTCRLIDRPLRPTFVDGLRNAGAEVVHIFVVFFYGAFPGAEETMAGLGVTLHFLATWNDVLKAAEEGQYFDQADIDGVRDFLDHPVEWSKDHGGRDAG